MTELELKQFVEKQVAAFLVFECDIPLDAIKRSVLLTSKSLSKRNTKYSINCDSLVPFSVYNSVQYCIFLYKLARDCHINEHNDSIAEKIYLLNKILNSVDLFYAIELPDIWGAEHPLSSVMGRASYGDFFFFYQGCTVGGSGGFYPTIGKHVTMYSDSKILGKSIIGDNVIISANTYIINETIPSNCIVFGQSPNLIIVSKDQKYILDKTNHIWKQD